MNSQRMHRSWFRTGLALLVLLPYQAAWPDSGRSDPDARRARQEGKDRQAEIAGWTNKDWESYGQSLTKDPEYQKMSPKDQAAYIADRVGAKLDEGGIVPNVSVFGRARSGVENGTLDSGTCSDLTEKLGSAFTGAGIDNGKVVVNQTGLSSYNPLNVNSDHGAPFVVIDGKKYVMDMWLHGGDQRGWISAGKFSGFKGSGFDGIALEDWKGIMEESGYDLSTVEEYYVDPKEEQARQDARKLVEDTARSLGVDPEGKSMGQLNEIIRTKAGELGLDPEGNKKVSELVEAIRDHQEEGEGASPPAPDVAPEPPEGETAAGAGTTPVEESSGADGEADETDARDAKTADGEPPATPEGSEPPPSDEADKTAGRGTGDAPGQNDGKGRSTGDVEPESDDEGPMAGDGEDPDLGDAEADSDGEDPDLGDAEADSDGDVTSPDGNGVLDGYAGKMGDKRSDEADKGFTLTKGASDVNKASNAGNDKEIEAQNIQDQSGQDAGGINQNTSSQIAAGDRENSWGKTLGDAMQKGMETGLGIAGAAFGNAAAGHVAGSIFKPKSTETPGGTGGDTTIASTPPPSGGGGGRRKDKKDSGSGSGGSSGGSDSCDGTGPDCTGTSTSAPTSGSGDPCDGTGPDCTETSTSAPTSGSGDPCDGTGPDCSDTGSDAGSGSGDTGGDSGGGDTGRGGECDGSGADCE